MYSTAHIYSMKDDFLYHYTSAENLLKILANMNLKLSTFVKLNDLGETDLNCNWTDSFSSLKAKRYIVEHCKLISFSRNYKHKGKLCQPGYNHPRMWAQYSNNNSGACIVINEKKLKEVNYNSLKGVFHKIASVTYRHSLFDSSIQESVDVQQFIKTNYKHIFFKKHIDWSHEGERRFFCIDGPEYLSIKDCVELVILGKEFGDEKYFELAKLLIMNKINLIPHDFAIQINNGGRITTFDNAARIIDLIKQINSLSKEYIEFLQEKGY